MVEKQSAPVKKYYDVVLETVTTVNLKFRVYAESPQEAAEMVSRNPLPPQSAAPKPVMSRIKRVKATVYRAGTTTYDYIKNFMR